MGRKVRVGSTLKREVLARDGHRCVKCGRKSGLEVHHLVPVVFGGQDALGNLVALCTSCHKEAPNEPADFFRWAATGLPPSMDMSKHLTKLCTSVLFHREGLGEKINKAEELIDQIYPDLWKVFQIDRTDDDPFRIQGIKHFLSKYLPPNEKAES